MAPGARHVPVALPPGVVTIADVNETVWRLLLDALDDGRAAVAYSLAACWGLMTEVCCSGDGDLHFDTADDLVRLTVRRLLVIAAQDFTAGADDKGQLVADAAFALAQLTGVPLGG